MHTQFVLHTSKIK